MIVAATVHRDINEPGKVKVRNVTISAAGSPIASTSGKVWYQKEIKTATAKCAQMSHIKPRSVLRSENDTSRDVCGTAIWLTTCRRDVLMPKDRIVPIIGMCAGLLEMVAISVTDN